MIHETAIVSEKADISEGVSVGPYSIIGPDVSIGSETIIESHVVITGRTTIGKQNHFYPFSTIGESPQDMKYKDEHRTWCDEPHAWYGLPGYFKSVKKHPCTLWLMESINNCKWLVDHHRATVLEYIKRYGKVHKLESTPMIYEAQLQYLDLPNVKRTKFANATPYKDMDNPIEAYRHFYNYDKSKFARWRYTDKPTWYMAT